jgi:hypothetical protein
VQWKELALPQDGEGEESPLRERKSEILEVFGAKSAQNLQ